MSEQLIDISPLISPRTAVWPGDVPFRRQQNLAISEGANIDLSAMHTTLHVGAHADAPSHYQGGGEAIAQRDLSRYYGPCQVIAVDLPRGSRILPRDLPTEITAPRVLFRTGSFPDPEHFNEDFCSLSPELIQLVAEQGGVLVGVDTPSIDPFRSVLLESHSAVGSADLAVLEGLVLSVVAPGLYTLIALPLKIEGADASPVRAALISP